MASAPASKDATSQALMSIRARAAELILPDPVISLSDWSDKYRVLSITSSAEAGRWRTDRTPYLREIMDALSNNSPYREVIFMKGSQIGGTEAGMNWISYVIDNSPGPMLVVQPNELLAKRFSKQRLDALVRDTPRLRGKIRTKKSRDSSNTSVMKEFDGGILMITGANAAPGLRSMPIKNLFLDEIDGYPQDVDGEGDPVSLAEKRTSTFPRRKVFKVSTPTFENRSRIKFAFDSSDQRFFHVPCPHCQGYQRIMWEQIKWEEGNFASAHMVCIHCERKISESNKTKMLAQGRWVAENPKAQKGIAGFHLSALYSPVGWYSWALAAFEWTEAQKSESKLRVFINTVLGETWKLKGEAPEWRILYDRREGYKFNVVPEGGLFLTAGADVQRDRIEIEIVAWGADKQSWSIDYRVILGDTSGERVYQALENVLNETFEVQNSDARLPIRLLAIDSGFNTQSVYNFSRGKAGRVVPIKGFENQQGIVGVPTPVEISYGGRKVPRGTRLWPVGVSTAKAELYGWLRLHPPTNTGESFPPGYCHFPEYQDDYFKMLTAEQLSVKTVRGYRKYFWEKIRERNEALDARVYARAAAAIVGIDRWSEKDFNDMRDSLRSNPRKHGPVPVKKSEKGGIPTKPSTYWD
jgi:phage terminase large subunit GpA-like protein